jgi:hypothetical protein
LGLLTFFGVADKISQYSYIDGETVYLEEDLDMGVFLDELSARGISYSINDEYQEETLIRHMSRYVEHNRPY